MICPNCGSQIEDGARFCVVCGTRMEEASSQWQSQYVQSQSSANGYAHTQSLVEANAAQSSVINQQAGPVPPRRNWRRIAIIAGAVALVVALVAVGVTFLVPHDSTTDEEEVEEVAEEPEREPGTLVGHLTMSDADFGTQNFADAIILDADENGTATLIYRGHYAAGTLEQVSEGDDTYVYKLRNARDLDGNELSSVVVTIEVPQGFTPDNMAGTWRMCYRDEAAKVTISDWAIVEDDGKTGVAGFSYEFDIFSVNRDYLQSNSSRRSWKKLDTGRYRITAPDQNGVERLIYVSE